jgi:FG-GAP-like repeat
MRLPLLVFGALAVVGCTEAPRRAELPVNEPPSPDSVKRVSLGDLMQRIHGFRPSADGFTSGGKGLHTTVTPSAAVLVKLPRVPNAPRAPLPLELATVTLRRGANAAREGQPALQPDGTVLVDRGVAVEHLTPSDGSLEQSWAFERRPEGTGDLEIAVAAAGPEFAGEGGSGIEFADAEAGARLRYGVATWIDAAGQRTVVQPRWSSGRILLRVPAELVESSAYPAVLDPIVGPVTTENNPMGAHFNITVAANPDGSALVLWTDDRLGLDDVYAARMLANGSVVIADFALNGRPIAVVPAVAEFTPHAAWDPATGTYFIVYGVEYNNGGNLFRDLRAVRYNPSNNNLSNEFTVDPTPRTITNPASVAVNNAGVVLVAEHHLINNNTDSDVTVFRFPAGTNTPDPPVSSTAGLGTSGDSGPSIPMLATDGTDFMLTYMCPVFGVYVHHAFASGNVFQGGEVRLATNPVFGGPVRNIYPTVAFGSGHYYLAWKFYDGTNNVADLRGMLLNTGGAPTTVAVVVAPAEVDETFNTAGWDGTRFLATFNEPGNHYRTRAVDPTTAAPIDVEPATAFYTIGDNTNQAESSSNGAGRTWVAWEKGNTNQVMLITFRAGGNACAVAGDCLSNNCGSNGVCCTTGSCNLPNTASTTCGPTGACQVGACNVGFLDCDGNPSTGCETVVGLANCGGCNIVCTAPNGTPACINSTCAIASCNSGFFDCDNVVGNGCEVSSSVADCGGCGAAAVPQPNNAFTCGGPAEHVSAATCSAGSCGGSTCAGGWCDLDGDKTIAGGGCETADTTLANCGAGCAPCTTSDLCKTAGCNAVDGNGDGVCSAINTSACATPICKLLVNNPNNCSTWADGDSDGLSDAWETAIPSQNGGVPFADLNCNGLWDGDAVDISLPGARPNVKDIFVYYNWMNAHPHQPAPEALDQVVKAFAAHSISLHFVSGGPVQETVVTTLDPAPAAACAGASVTTVQDLKKLPGFGPRNPAFHYMIFAHRAATPDAGHRGACPVDPTCGGTPDPDATGLADLPGDDLIVSFGALFDANTPPEPYLQASTIMHELGHNLGLKHGGFDACTVDKPNFISVMNPKTYQLNAIPVANGPGSALYRSCNDETQCGPPFVSTGPCATADACHCTTGLDQILGANLCYRLDYSTGNLIDLNEAAGGCDTNGRNCTSGGLDENVGVNGPPTDEDIVFYYTPNGSQLLGPSYGAIDWDNISPATGTHIKADINHDNSFTLLTTWNDWNSIDLLFQCKGGYGPGGAAFVAANEPSLSAVAAENGLGLPRKLGIDFRPGCTTNWVVVGSSDTVQVALYGEDTFDVTTINLTTIRLAGAQPTHVAMADLNGDGRQDLLFDFTMSSLGIATDSTSVTLAGARTTGRPIYGTDTITVVQSAGPIITLHDDGSGYSRTLTSSLNRDMVTFALSDCADRVTDRCGGLLDANAAGHILRITSDENGPGAGGGAADMSILSNSTFAVRKDRNGTGDGRVYTVIFTETDGNGKSTQAACRIQVPHDAGGNAAVDSGVKACVGTGC